MFPIRDENPTQHLSVATYALLAINILVWLGIQHFGSEPGLSKSICQFGAIPGELLGTVPAGTQFPLGGGAVCTITSVPSWQTVLTSMFMHGGWFHILGNMWFLYVFGDNVEDAMGPLRFVLFYLLCGAAAAGAQILSNPESPIPMVGASGAIGGVMGAYALLFPHIRVHVLLILVIIVTRIVLPAWAMLGYWFVIQFVGGAMAPAEGGGVAFWAHIGGFAAGALLVFVFRDRNRLGQRLVQHRTSV